MPWPSRSRTRSTTGSSRCRAPWSRPAGWTCDVTGQVLTCTVPRLAAGATAQVQDQCARSARTCRTRARSPTRRRSTSTTPDPILSNNKDADNIDTRVLVDLEIVKTHDRTADPRSAGTDGHLRPGGDQQRPVQRGCLADTHHCDRRGAGGDDLPQRRRFRCRVDLPDWPAGQRRRDLHARPGPGRERDRAHAEADVPDRPGGLRGADHAGQHRRGDRARARTATRRTTAAPTGARRQPDQPHGGQADTAAQPGAGRNQRHVRGRRDQRGTLVCLPGPARGHASRRDVLRVGHGRLDGPAPIRARTSRAAATAWTQGRRRSRSSRRCRRPSRTAPG